MSNIVLTAMVREKVNRGLGQTIAPPKGLGGIDALKGRIAGPEANGGLTDTMVDRTTIVAALRQLLDSITASGFDDELALIYVDFLRGDATRFHYAELYAFLKTPGDREFAKSGKLLVLGKVERNILGGGYRWKPPSTKVQNMIGNFRDMTNQLTEAMNAELRANTLSNL